MDVPALHDRDLEILRNTFRRFPSVREVKLFGSRANGTSKRASDIDLAVYAPEAGVSEWSSIREAIEETPIVFAFDIVRVETVTSARLLDKIEREGITIYPEGSGK